MKYLLLLLLLANCATTQNPQVQTQEPQKGQPCAKGTWCAVWNDAVKAKITPAILALDFSSFCPKYKALDKNAVAFAFVQSIVFAESGYDPAMDYKESSMGIDPITGKQVVSSGLLQLSCQDVVSKKYSKLPTASAMDCKAHPGAIYDAETNLRFGLEIMDYLAKLSPNIPSTSNSVGAYWSSARVPYKDAKGKWHHKDSHDKMLALMPECK